MMLLQNPLRNLRAKAEEKNQRFAGGSDFGGRI
jgi:hypothetical protein